MATLVSEIMEQDIISVNIVDSLKTVANVFENIKIRHLPVMSGDTLFGMVSKSDVSRMKQFCQVLDSGDKALYEELERVSIKAIMKSPITIDKSKTIKEATEILVKNHFHAIPVTDNGKMVGIVTSTDLLNYYTK
ncbi:MAG: CBS domain-containing protein [Reichenbachiella sp.]